MLLTSRTDRGSNVTFNVKSRFAEKRLYVVRAIIVEDKMADNWLLCRKFATMDYLSPVSN